MNGKADALTRRADYAVLKDKSDDPERLQPLLKSTQFKKPQTVLDISSLSTLQTFKISSDLLELVKASYKKDELSMKIIKELQAQTLDSRVVASSTTASEKPIAVQPAMPHLQSYALDNQGLLLFNNLIYVPSLAKDLQLRILQDHHDSPSAGHFGQAKTFELVSWNFYWLRL